MEEAEVEAARVFSLEAAAERTFPFLPSGYRSIVHIPSYVFSYPYVSVKIT
jgi:hypothetical protein